MKFEDRLNILLVDDQPAKLMSYEVILGELGENLIKAGSAREALEVLLKLEVAVMLIDVCMPELDGFELAAMIREHPRFQKTAIIFVSAVMMSEPDRLRGYEAGAVDYMPVPIVPDMLRAKVKVCTELFRKTRALEKLNSELEQRVAERTASLEASASRLQEIEKRRGLALVAARMGSFDVDLASGDCTWDEGQHRIWGFPAENSRLCRSVMSNIVVAEDRRHFEIGWNQAVELGTAYDIEFRIKRPDGETRWCVMSATASLNDEGEAVRLTGVTQDITERKEAEQALQRINEDLERRVEERTQERAQALSQLFEAQKMDTIGQLTGGVAHDFNNLLMAVLGSLELLKKRLNAEPSTMRLVDNAIHGAERGAALTQRLLAFARRQELKPESVSMSQLVQGMEGLLERALGPGVQLDVQLPDELPAVLVDPNQLELALLNLAVNARDAMPTGGVLTLSGSLEYIERRADLTPGAYVRICVSDSGMGMDEHTLAKATEPFFTTKGIGKGTGLGLSMVHGLAAQSGGLLTISSRPGTGSTVELWLPRASSAPLPQEPEREDAVSDGSDSITVLVVDDDALVCMGTSAMLEDLGHATIEARSGKEALELLKNHPEIDLVITDHAMPGMTGAELAARIQQSAPNLPLILATGYAELPDGGHTPARVPRLSKPFRQSDLVAAIARSRGV